MKQGTLHMHIMNTLSADIKKLSKAAVIYINF